MPIRKDAETPATSVHFIKTIANQLTGLQTVINRLAQATETLLTRAAENGGVSPELEAQLAKHASLQSDLLAEYSDMFSSLNDGASRVLLEMMRLGTSDARQLFDENGNLRAIADLPDDVAATIASVKVVKRPLNGKRKSASDDDDSEDTEFEEQTHEIKLWDKNKALTNLGKHFGLLRDIVEHSGPGGGPIEIDVSTKPIPLDALDSEDQMAMLEILERAERKRIERGGNGERIINVESRLLPERVPSAESNATPPLARRNVIPKPRVAPSLAED